MAATGEDLFRSYKKSEQSNSIISNMLAVQEKTIEEHTKALTKLTTKLVELIQFNSHNIREPLTRIMGLMGLYKLTTPEEFFKDYWPLPETSVRDMDATIRQVISNTENIEHHENFLS